MNPTTTGLFVLFLLPGAIAQTISGSAAAPSVLHATYGSQAQSVTVPAGPLGSSGGYSAYAPGTPGQFATAGVQWSFLNEPAGAQFWLQQNCSILGPAQAQCGYGPGDFVLTLQAPSLMPVLLKLHQDTSISAGMTVPTLLVDVGDNGSIEYVGGVAQTLTVHVGPAGLPIRVRTQIDLATTGGLSTSLFIQMVPADTLVQEVGLGCFSGGMLVQPTFNGFMGLQKTPALPFHYAWIPVIGFSIQPVVLPGPSPLCLLLPAPDAVLLSGNSSLYVFPIPAAVRPLTFWTQSVLLTPIGLVTGSTFQVNAL